ncbi:Fpg/Nei family DNA glycosylase [Leptolyngbya ohadii]|uniref:Fpg/Nei family DNA glycosylase n=1 Tax=Leptolyngbya ohadii TaxID=1962290 RepID=UPI000B59EABE|nr:DNA-formamidopyrimidine glycosylase family protein [Leptolyngbya ohadii]
MPEGPEVQRFADQLDRVLANQPIVQLTARTQVAKRWLTEHPEMLLGREIVRVSAFGKNLIGWIAGDYYFYSHLMMWGRWTTFTGVPPHEVDRRERARIITATGGAILLSAPVFQLGQGNPYTQIEILRSLGADILPQSSEPFDQARFVEALRLSQPDRTIGAALLDQSIAAGIGNYLRAEILFLCQLDPWRRVGDLTEQNLHQLCQTVPQVARRAYETGGFTVSDLDRTRMQQDPGLVYRSGSEWGTRHYVFRRTNLPCLRCNTPIRQQKQLVRTDGTEEKTRIIYFCPVCQQVSINLKPRSTKRSTADTTI